MRFSLFRGDIFRNGKNSLVNFATAVCVFKFKKYQIGNFINVNDDAKNLIGDEIKFL